MTLDTAALFVPATGPTGTGSTRTCRRHNWSDVARIPVVGDEGMYHVSEVACSRCGRVRDDAAVARSKRNRRAGKDAERAIAKAYPGGKRTGHLGGADDVLVGELFIVQSKAGVTWFRESYWAELEKLPRAGGRIPTLIVSDRPGPGRKTRRMVVRMMDDDVDLHGNPEEAA